MQEEKMHRSTYRVLKIFELLSATSEGMSLTGLAQKLEIPKGSLHPILKTMQAMNFIRMNDNGNYTIGQAAYFAGSSYTKNSDLLQEINGQNLHLIRTTGLVSAQLFQKVLLAVQEIMLRFLLYLETE